MFGVHPFVLLLLCFLLSLTGGAANALNNGDDWGVSKGSRDEQIVFWESEIRKLRDGQLSKAYDAMYSTQYALEEAQRRRGWLFTKEEDRARIKMLDEEHKRNMAEVALLRQQEDMMLAKVKPLYGVLSRRFAQEQRDAIAGSLRTVQEMSYNQAWYSSLFNIRNAETFTDIIVGFLLEWMIGYIVMYPFAALYYAFWVAPWSIYAYSSGPSDVFLGTIVWCASVTVMLTPLLALVGGFWYVKAKHGDRIAEAFRTAREREGGRRGYNY